MCVRKDTNMIVTLSEPKNQEIPFLSVYRKEGDISENHYLAQALPALGIGPLVALDFSGWLPDELSLPFPGRWLAECGRARQVLLVDVAQLLRRDRAGGYFLGKPLEL